MKREYYLNALICLLLLRVVMLGGSLADAVTLSAFAIYLSFVQYVNVKRWKNDAEDITKRLDELYQSLENSKKNLQAKDEDLLKELQIVSAKVDQVKMGMSLSQGIRK